MLAGLTRAPLKRRGSRHLAHRLGAVDRNTVLQLHDLAGAGRLAVEPAYNMLVWQPNVLGSVCFLISGAIFYLSSPRRGWLPERRHLGWWEPSANLLGCVLFGVSALAGLVISSAGAMVNASAANWTTSLGAACFLGCALAALSFGQTLKAPRLRRLQAMARELEQVGVAIGSDVRKLGGAAERELQQVGLVIEPDIERIELAVERHLGQGEI
jgi:hypothetical protein